MHNNPTCTGCPWPNDPDCEYCQTPAKVEEECRKKIAFKRRHNIDREKAKAEKALHILQASIDRRSLKANEKKAISKNLKNVAKKLKADEKEAISKKLKNVAKKLKTDEKDAISKKLKNVAKKVHLSATVIIPLYQKNISGNKSSDIKEKLQKIISNKETSTKDICICKKTLLAFKLASYYNGCFVSAWHTTHGTNIKFNFSDKNSLEKFKNDWADIIQENVLK